MTTITCYRCKERIEVPTHLTPSARLMLHWSEKHPEIWEENIERK